MACLRGLFLLIVLALAAAASAPGRAMAGDGDGLADWLQRAPSAMRALSAPMKLGFPADRWQTMVHAAEGMKGAERCRRWRAAADNLGETFAGHTLRKTIVRRHCALFEGDGTAARWEWPWISLERASAVPLRLHKAFGPWAIRCGTGEARRRCALLYDDASASPALGVATPAISTHFVIDRVAGREMLLWRVFVPLPSPAPSSVAGLGHPGRSEIDIANTFKAEREVRYRVGRADHRERFPVCTPAGCLMEVRAEASGAVATELADGSPVTVAVTGGDSTPLEIVLPSRGFAAAFAELNRLRRLERRAGRGE